MKITNSFLWGAATSSYQVEGSITNNDWSLFTTSEEIKNRISSLTKPSIFYKGRGQVHLQSAGEGVRFWDPKFYVEDFEIARRLGMNSFRISLEWSGLLSASVYLPEPHSCILFSKVCRRSIGR